MDDHPVEDNDWIVLQSEDHGYAVQPGQVFEWANSFCCHMVAGKGPRIAPRSEEIPLYATAPINQHFCIKSYIGQPLLKKMAVYLGHYVRLILKPSQMPSFRIWRWSSYLASF